MTNNKNKQVLIFLNTCILILATITATYAYLKVALNNTNNMKVLISTDTLNLIFSDGDSGFNTELAYGESVTKTFVVENKSSKEMEFQIMFKKLLSKYKGRSLSYTFSYSDNLYGIYNPIEIDEYLFGDDYVDYYCDCAVWYYDYIYASVTKNPLTIPAKTTYYYKLSISLNLLDDVDQTGELSWGEFSTQFDIIESKYAPNMMKELKYNDSFNKNYYYKYNDIENVTILNDGVNVPNNAIESWDMSSLNDGSVIAYVTDNDNDTHDLYITANGNIFANYNSSYMFASLKSIKNINNINNINTEYSKNMNSLFYKCEELLQLNLSNFNTSNVEDISWMFAGCWDITSINIGNFNTSKVKSMYGLFTGCSSLESIDVSHFDTSNVTDISWMFTDCELITSLNVSNFDTSNVTNM